MITTVIFSMIELMTDAEGFNEYAGIKNRQRGTGKRNEMQWKGNQSLSRDSRWNRCMKDCYPFVLIEIPSSGASICPTALRDSFFRHPHLMSALLEISVI
jgi:hypothetical protein